MAIEKANREVKPKDRLKEKEIEGIIKYIEDLGEKRILVEDIQDMIERKIMECKKYELAKRYIVYRYTRALVRKKNTTDESILGLIKTTNKGYRQTNSIQDITVAKQRDLIAGEVSKDLTNRILLPEKITQAHNEGVLYFHNSEYFLQPIFNSCVPNIEDMLKNGTVINEKLINTPNDFITACIVFSQIVLQIASNQYGEQIININFLGEFLNKTYNNLKVQNEKETQLKEIISKGIEIIYYQLNTVMSTNGDTPKITIVLNIDEENEYCKENIMIIEEILKQKYKGMKNEKKEYTDPKVPKLIYVLNKETLLDGKYKNITELAIRCSEKTSYPEYISSKKYHNKYMFNQGIISINLPQIAMNANKDNFWNILDERLDLCYEALMCRHYALLGTLSDISPIHWRHGAIARMNSGHNIDELLKSEHSTISLQYEGLYEVTKIMVNESLYTKQGNEFAIKLLKYIKNKLEKWKQESNVNFILCGIDNTEAKYKLFKTDNENGLILENNEKSYRNSIIQKYNDEVNINDILKYETKINNISIGGYKSYIDILYIKNKTQEEIKELLEYIYNNGIYFKFKKLNNK